jgi:DHA2 family lincomycin resistance protein-like MFS transporter
MNSTTLAAGTELSARNRLVINLLLVSAFVVILNETIMSVAIPRLMASLGVTASAAQWLTTAFLLTMAVVIPMTGFLLQRLSTRTSFTIAMSLFSTGTLAAALAPGLGLLVVARVIQASGTAIMLPLLMTTVMTLVPPETRGKTMGNITTVISVAPAIGPTLSGLILNYLHWRWLFVLVLPIAVASLWLGVRRIENVTTPREAPLDVLSVILSAFAFGGAVYGLSLLGVPRQAGNPPAWMPLAVGGVAMVAFVRRQLVLQRTNTALLDLRTFGSRNFTICLLLFATLMLVLLGTIIVLPIYLQNVLGISTLQTGLLLLPGGLLMGLLGPWVGRQYDRIGPSRLVIPGIVIVTAVLWAMTQARHADPRRIHPGRTCRHVRGVRTAVHAALHCEPVVRAARALLARQRCAGFTATGSRRRRRRVVHCADVGAGGASLGRRGGARRCARRRDPCSVSLRRRGRVVRGCLGVFRAQARGVRDAHALDTGKPLVAAVFPVAAFAAPDTVEGAHHFDAHDVLRHLVPELALDAHTQRSAVLDRQHLSVQLVRQDRLRVQGIFQVDALVVLLRSAPHRVRTVKNDVARVRLQPHEREDVTERHAGPFADCAPSFDAIVPRDLCAARHRPQLREREGCGLLHQSVDLELPVVESACRQRLVFGVLGILRPVAAELRRKVGFREFLCHRASRSQEMLRAAAQALADAEQPWKPGALRECVATRQQRGARTDQRVSQEVSARVHAWPHDRSSEPIL